MPRHCIPAGSVHDRPSTRTGNVGVSPMLSFAGVRSPPLQERRSKVRWPRGGRPGDGVRGGFLGGTHSVRPRGKAGREPREVMIRDELARGRWPKGGAIWVGVMPSWRACGARPSAARPSEGEAALRGRAGNDAKGGFLGGTRSPRPQVRAGRKPEQVMIRDELARGGRPKGGAIWVGLMPSLRACGARP
jgi:hypothetical protein